MKGFRNVLASSVVATAAVLLFTAFTNLTQQPTRQPKFVGLAASGTTFCLGNVGNSGNDTFSDITCNNSGNAALDVTTQAPVNNTGTGITSNHTGFVRPWVNTVTLTNAVLTAAGSTDVTILTTSPGAPNRIVRVLAEVTQVFTGGTLSAMTIQCGNSAGGTQYLLAGSVFAATTALGDVQAEVGAGLLTATWADFGTVSNGVPGSIVVQCRFTCTGDTCNHATQGNVIINVEGVAYGP